jgi:hypothetical protein
VNLLLDRVNEIRWDLRAFISRGRWSRKPCGLLATVLDDDDDGGGKRRREKHVT